MKTLLLILSLSFSAHAFIPASDYVVTRVVKSHGKGVFMLENEVTFKSETETLVAREYWTIQDGDTMKLNVKSGAMNLTFLYRDGKVYFSENEGSVLSRKLSVESLERFFNARTEKTFSELLMAAKVLTANPMRNRPRAHDVKFIKPESDPFMQLVRIDDDPTILISSTANAKEALSAHGLWVDQENFAIRKIKFPSQSEVQALNYQSIGNEFLAARLRVVSWNQNKVEIRLLRSKGLAKTKDLEAQFATNSLLQSPQQWGGSSLLPQVKEFYQRFR